MSTSDRPAFDRHMMSIALRLAERGLGNVAPNPAVGALIVDERCGEVIARGWTQPGGRPHAETEAIRRAGPRAKGATLYVTLEPCSHHGHTPPCADAVIAAGIKRVVCAIMDPDPRVAGRGLDRLRDAGIEVTHRICRDDADWITKGHILRVSERRPMVWLKMAFSSAGTLARGSGKEPAWVTGPAARAHGHLLRANCDAILVGRGTVADDNPQLTCRLPGLEQRSARPIVLAGAGWPDPDAHLIKQAAANKVWLFASHQAPAAVREELAAAGCHITEVADVEGRLWLPAVMEHLVAAGVTRLLVEGGPSVWQSFFAAGLVDAVVQYRAKDPAATIEQHQQDALATIKAHAGRHEFSLIDQRQIGEDRMYIYRRSHGS